MALLTLENIGKIYVSEGTVSVGIRGVNLSFDKGEFVAVTGKSGSGKSTLLNVISGMDTYEEGELYIDGKATSHYLQPDWEAYREQYVSFIFQDYNIIESFTVLQNVELALMHIENPKERRAKAVELLRRVGMESHLSHKGSRLSGGQKQRTVIARALAKDSPIILADEPTGNLDSATSKEIIQLLKEVSKDKLLIVVTHNFEQVEAYATRHVRIFDGTVESDVRMEQRNSQSPNEAASLKHGAAESEKAPKSEPSEQASDADRPKKKSKKGDLRNGILLGKTMFTSRPKLSVFLVLLMLISTFGIFSVTAVSGHAADLLKKETMFQHYDGRVVTVRKDGLPMTEAELAELAQKTGADRRLHFDFLLDRGKTMIYQDQVGSYLNLSYTVEENFGEKIIGRYPQAKNEVFLRLPISMQPVYGKNEIQKGHILLENCQFEVVGLQYFYDNNQQAKALFSEEGFHAVTALHCLLNGRSDKCSLNAVLQKSGISDFTYGDIFPSFDLQGEQVSIVHSLFWNTCREILEESQKSDPNGAVPEDFLNMTLSARVESLSNNGYGPPDSTVKKLSVDPSLLTETDPGFSDALKEYFDDRGYAPNSQNGYAFLSVEFAERIFDELYTSAYRQASLFFANDKEAAAAIPGLSDSGYIAVLSNTPYSPDPLEGILNAIGAFGAAFMWVVAILFLGFFYCLVSRRSLNAFKGDMAIMRSMGISVRVIRIAMYVRMLICVIPAYLTVVLLAVMIFRTPMLNRFFTYLYGWQYLLIFAGVLILTVRVTGDQIRRLFNESVKKSLKGGKAQ